MNPASTPGQNNANGLAVGQACGICTQFVGHISVDAGVDSPWFCEAHRILSESFQREPQQTIIALQKRVTELESELIQLKRTSPVKTAGIKRKSDPSDRMDIDNSHPAKRATTTTTEVSESSVIVPHIGFHVIDAEARPNPAIDHLLIEYSEFLPGNHLHALKFSWNQNNGSIIVPDYIHHHIKSNRIPHVRSFNGPTAGTQTLPTTQAQLDALITGAHTNGDWASLIRLRLTRGLATLLEYIYSRSPDTVSALQGAARRVLSTDINPVWAHHSSFSDPSQFIRNDDSFDNWKNSPTDIPAVPLKPRDDLSDIEFAHGVMVHYNPSSHLGLITSDTYSCYLPSIHGLRLYLQIAPVASDSDKSFGDTTFHFRTNFVTLAAMYGLYASIVARDHLIIPNDAFKPVRCTKTDVKSIPALCARLAAMGVTVSMMDSLYPWGLQYCLDVCDRPNLFKAQIRRHYAEIFINAHHRLMFYPLPDLLNLTFIAHDHWKPEHITEYRRRRAVVRHWRESGNPKYMKDKEISVTRHNAFPDNDTTADGVAGMAIDNAPTQTPDGNQPVAGPSGV
ncbi:hypothetical protein L218DRAFT_1029307 [Marasmius fiardii PR-910]|nr:hypothetical protein L218DRAFT_1029307 [Marasmius fiardii PR-910]